MTTASDQSGFRRLRDAIEAVVRLRQQAWHAIVEHLSRLRPAGDGGETTRASRVRRVCVLVSSSRGGGSVTAEMLQWQGAECDVWGRRILSLPGEEKPHLILAGLAYPARSERYDDLEAPDACASAVEGLLNEVSSEIGYPAAQTSDWHLYASQLYRRLLLQWPFEMIRLHPEAVTCSIADTLLRAFPEGYRDTPDNRRRVLDCCVSCFPFIRSSFYDCGILRNTSDARLLAHGAWSYEEPPFVLPPPWHHASAAEVECGTLLLRDPSNAWRLPFWRVTFPTQDIRLLHLVRDVAESVQGLCDGWNYVFGFQTLPSDLPLRISGYSNHVTSVETAWKRFRLNFSVDRQLSELLLTDRRPMELAHVCSMQWRFAHERILADASILSLPRLQLQFSDVRSQPLQALENACVALNLGVSKSGADYGRSFSSRRVMATDTNDRGVSFERWRQSPYASVITRLAKSEDVANVARCLGLTRVRDD